MRVRAALLAIAATGGIVAPAVAHHSFSMFDQTKTLMWQGTVKEYKWSNPHTHIIIVVPANKPMAGTWDIEGASPNIMLRQGWNKGTFKPGDKITVAGHPLRSGEKGASLYYAISPTGQKLYHDVSRAPGG
ncbi:MAG: hypothetical protein KF730_03290 [Sphingomonas sp.]|uniref:DUF6152 family protein n=1 Tax=Sphingomonas sp. TaxID=28214 RepID=UPI0025FB520A|nr:DUF6152 family protein [Sphingomonas sp.]MBX3563582.1 hypothetical protein [Sphingomonas sp.]